MDRSGLRVASLTHEYARGRRRVTAVDRVSFGVDGGDIVAVVGRNGAGKSTLLRVLAGILRPTSGEAWVGNAHVGSPEARARIGFAFDPAEIPPEITGAEWLRYLASHHARLPPQRLRAVRRAIEIGQLHEFADRRVGQYSKGMAQRLATAAAVVSGREVMLLDETLNGLDPLVARDLRESLRDLAAGGRAILVATHDLATVERLAHRVLVLHRGRLLLDQLVSSLVSERFLEITLNGDTNRYAPWLMARFPDTVRTGVGVRVPLRRGVSAELVLAICRSESVPVLGSRVRYRELEDVLEEVTRERAGLPVS